MLAEPEIRALRAHVSLIEQFEADREREEARLREPHKARAAELEAILARNEPPYDEHVRIELKYNDILSCIANALWRFDAANKPKVEPYDTPSKLVGWIDGRFHWMHRRRRALEATETGRAVIAADPARFPRRHRPDLPAYPEAESRDIYREARRRALAFAGLVPAVLDRFPEASDPILGLQEIRAWFAAVDKRIKSPGLGKAVADPVEQPAPNGPAAHDPEAPSELMNLVTLDQAAALVNRAARTLERYKRRGLPKPLVRGGGGKPHEYLWPEMREWLQKTFDRAIPETAIQRFRHPKNAGRH
jgi:hypothetical protein